MEFIPSRARNPYDLSCCLAVACDVLLSFGAKVTDLFNPVQPVAGLFCSVTCYGVYSEQSEESLRSFMLPRGSLRCSAVVWRKSHRFIQSGAAGGGAVLLCDLLWSLFRAERGIPTIFHAASR